MKQKRFEFIKKPAQIPELFHSMNAVGEAILFDEDLEQENMDTFNNENRPLEIMFSWQQTVGIKNDFDTDDRQVTKALRVKLAKQNGKPYIDSLRAHLYAEVDKAVEQIEKLAREDEQ